jgi:hypothetical protein
MCECDVAAATLWTAESTRHRLPSLWFLALCCPAPRDGMVRAVSSRSGQLLWEFDTAREFTTVNGVAANGGSAASCGPIVANGMVFIGSGYPGFQNGQPGNVLLAFAPAVRLDAFADERKQKTAGTK